MEYVKNETVFIRDDLMEIARDFLLALRPGAFDLGVVTNYVLDEKVNEDLDVFMHKLPREYTCGAAACVVGWMPRMFYDYNVPIMYGPHGVQYTSHSGEEMWDSQYDAIASEVFGVPERVANHICTPMYYPDDKPTAEQVADRLDRLVRYIQSRNKPVTEEQLVQFVMDREITEWRAKVSSLQSILDNCALEANENDDA